MTTSTLTPAQVFQQLTALAANTVFISAMPVITNALSQVEANPQQVLNPLNSGIFAVQFMANLQAVLPTIENDAVQATAQLVEAFLTAVTTKFATAGTTAAAIGTEVGQAVAGA